MSNEQSDRPEPDPSNDPADDVDSSVASPPATDDPPTITSDDFLVPGPSPESNAGLARWGLTWIAFSLLLILMMLCLSFVCLTLANWTGIA